MKKTLLTILGVLVVAVVGLVGFASTKPDAYHVERSVSIAAMPADAFPFVNDFTKWHGWNPFRHGDANMTTETSENPVGVGAWTSWKGNGQVGEGKMTITEITPDAQVIEHIDFTAPMQDQGTATFSMAAEGDGTKFTWAMDGEMNLISKVMDTVVGMEAMIGPQFEAGLVELKPQVEAAAKARVEAEAAAAAAAAAAPVDGAAPADGASPAEDPAAATP